MRYVARGDTTVLNAYLAAPLREYLRGLQAQVHALDALPALASVPVGLLASALLVVNNLRDIPTDTKAGKRTLAVKLGERFTRAQ